ncbi:hypothetical protein LCGC14_1414570 [marine sediment metagenome]|uniref:MotA/TolQ/ExbB proton channel domain-containing protein n=1 Tax=marine sediment metagenome TaxID=412755 RepID=A0A0F9JTJ5_9ZZZZ
MSPEQINDLLKAFVVGCCTGAIVSVAAMALFVLPYLRARIISEYEWRREAELKLTNCTSCHEENQS